MFSKINNNNKMLKKVTIIVYRNKILLKKLNKLNKCREIMTQSINQKLKIIIKLSKYIL